MHPGLPRKMDLRERENHRYRRITPAFPAQWFYGLLRALLGEPVLVCHRRLVRAFGASPRLGASVGAPGPHDFAVRNRCRSSVSRITSTAFRSTFVTTRTPLLPARNAES
jgi:hypothetical protein